MPGLGGRVAIPPSAPRHWSWAVPDPQRLPGSQTSQRDLPLPGRGPLQLWQWAWREEERERSEMNMLQANVRKWNEHLLLSWGQINQGRTDESTAFPQADCQGKARGWAGTGHYMCLGQCYSCTVLFSMPLASPLSDQTCLKCPEETHASPLGLCYTANFAPIPFCCLPAPQFPFPSLPLKHVS